MQQKFRLASSQINPGPSLARSKYNPSPTAAQARQHLSMSSASLSTGPSSSSGHHHSSSTSSISANACLVLVQQALDHAKRDARKADADQHPGLTIDLSHQRIAHIPLEVISLIKDDIERLALAHNRLSGFSDAFSQLSRLRYLNLRSNQIREFPLSLCKLPSLEILDISRNQLGALPPDLGNLMSLKVLSMSKNLIEELPTYIGSMQDLKILKIDHNPIMFPPRDVMELAGEGEDFRDTRLDLIKRYLRNAETKGTKETESASSDEGETDYSHITVKHPFQSNHSQGLPTQPRPPPIPSRSQQRSLSQKRNGRLEGTNSLPGPPTLSASGYIVSSGPGLSPTHPSSLHERSRSNSESTVQNERANKRMGNIFARKEKLGTVDEAKSAKHHHVRGYSHDSIIENQHRTHDKPTEQISASRSPTDPDRPTAGHYFRRLSSLPEQKRSSMSTARVAESARGILYSLSQSHTAISIFINNSGDRSRHAPLERVLFFANNQIGNLVRALEGYDAKGDEHAVEPVLAACNSCLAAFRQVMSLLQSSLREISSESDVRLTRTLLLMIYGTSVELQNSWAALRPILPQPPTANNYFQSHGPRHMGLPGNVRMKSISSNSSSISLISSSQSIPPPLATPRSPDTTFQVPPTPSIASSLYASEGIPENDEPLFENVNAATMAALSTLPQITDAITKMAVGQSLHPNTMIKMKELDTLCSNTKETARRLKSRLDVIRDYIKENNTAERRKFWDDTNLFIKMKSSSMSGI
ncbi:RAM signaling pathway protein-domain-containing protein [Peziza echinospora]|nr:RAM signaling pathway protein-domain-containing protein [Peziza echinospora]